MKQTYTSANTSINKNKLPAIYNKIDWEQYSYMSVLDIGCGKYTNHIEELMKSHNNSYCGYDPYNKPNSQLDYCLIGICSNVLNVIDSEDAIIEVVEQLAKYTRQSFITVYEGDKSGIGKVTKNDCYQRNQKLDWYLQLILNKTDYYAEIKNGMIIMYT